MGNRSLDQDKIRTLGAVITAHVEEGELPGVAWGVRRGEQVEVGCAGVVAVDGAPVARDSIFRIASMTKPVTAVAALILVEECRLRLDDPVDDLLPEMANRRVLVDGRGGLDGETVPATRSITLDDLLTFRLGLG